MTVEEFSLEFDILYDNIMSKSAPGIDEYEKSVYLTKAQLEIIKTYSSGANKYNQGFDGSEKRRIDLKELIKDFKSSIITQNDLNIDSNARFVVIPQDVLLIKMEKGEILDPKCGKVDIDIIPITLDEYLEKKDNPFRKPNKTRGYRVDFNSSDLSNNSVEIITSSPLLSYQMRYLKYPNPIILTNLNEDEFEGMGLSIDGQITSQTCMLNKEIHREILDRAVELAILDYKSNNLQNKVEINNRNN